MGVSVGRGEGGDRGVWSGGFKDGFDITCYFVISRLSSQLSF